MNKVQMKSWKEARAELARVAAACDCAAFDRALAEGRKVSAIALLRRFGIDLHAQ